MSTYITPTLKMSPVVNPATTMEPLLRELLGIATETGNCIGVRNWLVALGRANDWNPMEDETGNVYLTKGIAETYPCIVSHMDTVHDIEKSGALIPVEIDGYVTGINSTSMKQSGIGGDDKCGVWAGVRCLQELDYCKAVFFVDEERGCAGSGHCDMTFFSNCRFILQADRRGYKDFVNEISWSPLSSSEFLEAVAPLLVEYGYELSDGLMTDVMALRDAKVGISVANMSAGYYNPHCASEFISLYALDNCIRLMQAICTTLTDTYPFIAPERAAVSHCGGGWEGAWDTSDYWTRLRDGKSSGGNSVSDGKREPFPDWDGKGGYHCSGCGELKYGLVAAKWNGTKLCIDCATQMDWAERALERDDGVAQLMMNLGNLSESELERHLKASRLTKREKRRARNWWRRLKRDAAR